MDRLFVTGGAPLTGSLRVSGAKNSALKLMAAAMLAPGCSVVRNVPRIRDCSVMADLLGHFGVGVELRSGIAELDATDVRGFEAPHDLVGQIRASIVVLGPLLARTGHARVSLPGGDEIGARPVELHVRGLERMGATVRSEHGFLVAEASSLHGAMITLDYPSVTATENLLLAGVLARGTTVIDNAAREPEVADLADFLVSMGARVHGAGSSTVVVDGVDGLHPADHDAVPDRIEAGTWAAAAVATRGDITIENARPQHLDLFLTKLEDAGAEVTREPDGGAGGGGGGGPPPPPPAPLTSSRSRIRGSPRTSSRSCSRCSPSPTGRASRPRTSSKVGSPTWVSSDGWAPTSAPRVTTR
jgi:UDP-N-acetylglucosamine 1-carboxyvinyltransferase